MTITHNDIIKTARFAIDTPYKHQGRKIGVGLDCIGLPIVVAKKLGLGDFDRKDYGRQPDGSLLQKINQVCCPIFMQSGAILVFQIDKEPQHCGILGRNAQGYTLIHAWDIADKVCEHRLGDWRNKIVGCFGFPGVEYK